MDWQHPTPLKKCYQFITFLGMLVPAQIYLDHTDIWVGASTFLEQKQE